jgi:hypothetical protein
MVDPPAQPDDTQVGTPLWVKVFGVIALVVVVLFVVLLLIGGGSHGPGRHSAPAGVTELGAPRHS